MLYSSYCFMLSLPPVSTCISGGRIPLMAESDVTNVSFLHNDSIKVDCLSTHLPNIQKKGLVPHVMICGITSIPSRRLFLLYILVL